MQILDRLRHRTPTEDISGDVTLIIGLGNPGREFAGHRHNIGFQIADRWAAVHDLKFSKMQQRAIIASGRIRDRRVIAAKPQTYMNDSGRSVAALMRFYKVPLDRLLVLFDDLDLLFGVIRLRSDGGAGGHNGMRSIIGQLGTNQFARLRFGIGRPPGRMDPAAFVLQDFNRDEAAELSGIVDRAVEAIDVFIASGVTAAMNKYNPTSTGEKRL
jgi:PTH1 family peptidyl-tRNA hydrolase